MRPLRTVLGLSIAAALAVPGAAGAASLPADTTAILSGTTDLLSAFASPFNNSVITRLASSADGRRVAFTSGSDGLAADDDDDVDNVYVQDAVSGALIVASRRAGAAGEPSHRDCFALAISDDGNRVAMYCQGSLDPADTNAFPDIYVRDLTTDETLLASRASGDGQVGDAPSEPDAALDATGRHVVFRSRASNLTSPTPGPSLLGHIYRRELDGGRATVLVTPLGIDPRATDVSVSDDGNRVAFLAVGPVVPGLTEHQIFVRDIAAQTYELVSRASGSSGDAGNKSSSDPMISGDGRSVVFSSSASNLSPQDPELRGDVDIYVRTATTTTLVSMAGATKANRNSRQPSIGTTAGTIAFASNATNLDPADTTGGVDVYVTDGTTVKLASVRADGSAANDAETGSLSGDGRHVAISAETGLVPGVSPIRPSVVSRDVAARVTRPVSRPAGTAPLLDESGDTLGGALSADGRYAVMTTAAPGLGGRGDVDAAVVVRDLATGAVTVASRADGRDGHLLSSVRRGAAISGDGRRVAFIADGPHSRPNVFVRDLPGGRTFLASREDGPAGIAAGVSIQPPSLSADGRRVTFLTAATTLDPADTSPSLDAYLRDLEDDRTLLISRADGPSGAAANDVQAATISGDGRHVAFVTAASGLNDGDTDTTPDVHLRSLDIGTTRLVSVAGEATKGDRESDRPSVNHDGTHVAFVSTSTNFSGPAGVPSAYVRDIGARTLTLASRADGTVGAPLSVYGLPVLSGDGSALAFTTAAFDVVLRTLAAGRSQLANRRPGPAGELVQNSTAAGISADGGCVAFFTDDRVLGEHSRDRYNVYVRAFTANCGRPAPPSPPSTDAPTAPAPGGQPVPPRPPSTDRTPPRLTLIKLSRTRFRPTTKPTSTPKGARGATLSLSSNEPGKLTLTIDRRRPGKRSGTTCRPVHRTPKTDACSAYTRRGTVQRSLKSGADRIPLTGHLRKKPLAPGRYRITITATDAAGNTTKVAKTLTITIAH